MTMASNATTGDRRWASAKKSGMTVLGKVSVPKPINLPSQRLENRGLDPNVEIVPKGTLSWGSRSSSGTNAWSTSASSPSTDGRPSSSSGTRPSTAGSEIARDSNVIAWSSNSRPSSASGSSASNKDSLASLRPRSADTRPGSSQLSRFAEPCPESGTWGSGATSVRIGLGNSGKDGFSLSSGDFPTLGSEKDESRKNTEPQDDIRRNADFKDGSWRKVGPSYDDGPRRSSDRCNEEPHPYRNPHIAPHYESWRGPPPVNPAGPMWYNGPHGPPPLYGAPGGFPMEPFHYYPPQVRAPGLANSHVAPPRGVGPHGHYPTNGDMYRPHMPESCMRPGMPVGPGFYPGRVPYEACYGPSTGLHNPMGRPTGPPVYGRPVHLNVPDPKHAHSRPSQVGAPDQADTCHPRDPRENPMVVKEQSDHWSRNDGQRWGHKGMYASNNEKGILSKAPMQDNAWGDDYRKDEDMHFEKITPAVKDGSDELDGMQFVNSKVDRSANIVPERHYPSGVPVQYSHDINIAPVDRNHESTVPFVNATSRELTRGAHSRNNHGQVSFNGKEDNGWSKRPESQAIISPAGSESKTKNQVVEHHALYPTKVSESNPQKEEQRAKMKEIAKQRALQLQKEEEERIRDQKAKALAKLKELDRRSTNKKEDNPDCKLENVPSHSAGSPNQDDPRNHVERRVDANHFVPKKQTSAGDTSNSIVPSVQARAEAVKTSSHDSASSQNQLPTHDVDVENAADQRTTPTHEALRVKPMGNKQRQNIVTEKIPVAGSDVAKDDTDSAGSEGVAGGGVASGPGKNKNKSVCDPNVTEAMSGTEQPAVKDVTHTSESHALTHEDAHTKQNQSWKPQHSRKPRSSQGNRLEKSHNNDAVVWAPVRSHNKGEAVDLTSQKAVDEPSALSVTVDNVVSNSPKTKRAEMERYVPKPIIQQSPSPPVDLGMKGSKGSNYPSRSGSSVDSKHVDGKHKQRGHVSQSQLVQVSKDIGAVVTEKNSDITNESGKNVKSDETSARRPPSRSDHDFGWNSPNDSDFSSPAAVAGGKGNAHSGRGKRLPFKGHRGSKAGSNELPQPPIETSQTETAMPSKESRAVGDRAMSQWKPKSHGFVGHDQQGSRPHNHQNPITEETNKAMKRDTGHSGTTSHKLFQNSMASEPTDVGHHDNKMGKLVTSSNQVFIGEVACVTEGHNEHRPYWKNADQSGGFNKGHESREEWNSTEQENKQHYGNRERPRTNTHLEYQPVDSYGRRNNHPSDHGAQTENQSSGMKFRGRGQSHARRGRGTFYGRQRGTPADAGNA